jgi:hypothetical protein
MAHAHALPPRVLKLIEDLNSSFWQQWSEATTQFPDTPDCSNLALVSLQSAIISITTNYIIGFQGTDRILYLEELIKSLRYMESQLRDVE